MQRMPKARLHDGSLARADALEQAAVAGADEQAVVLLVLGAPDLQHAHGLVAQPDRAHVDLGAQRVDDLLHLRAPRASWAAARCINTLPYPTLHHVVTSAARRATPGHQCLHPVRPACSVLSVHDVTRGGSAVLGRGPGRRALPSASGARPDPPAPFNACKATSPARRGAGSPRRPNPVTRASARAARRARAGTRHVAVAAGALVVDLADGVVRAQLHARAHHAPQLLRHLRIAALQARSQRAQSAPPSALCNPRPTPATRRRSSTRPELGLHAPHRARRTPCPRSPHHARPRSTPTTRTPCRVLRGFRRMPAQHHSRVGQRGPAAHAALQQRRSPFALAALHLAAAWAHKAGAGA